MSSYCRFEDSQTRKTKLWDQTTNNEFLLVNKLSETRYHKEVLPTAATQQQKALIATATAINSNRFATMDQQKAIFYHQLQQRMNSAGDASCSSGNTGALNAAQAVSGVAGISSAVINSMDESQRATLITHAAQQQQALQLLQQHQHLQQQQAHLQQQAQLQQQPYLNIALASLRTLHPVIQPTFLSPQPLIDQYNAISAASAQAQVLAQAQQQQPLNSKFPDVIEIDSGGEELPRSKHKSSPSLSHDSDGSSPILNGIKKSIKAKAVEAQQTFTGGENANKRKKTSSKDEESPLKKSRGLPKKRHKAADEANKLDNRERIASKVNKTAANKETKNKRDIDDKGKGKVKKSPSLNLKESSSKKLPSSTLKRDTQVQKAVKCPSPSSTFNIDLSPRQDQKSIIGPLVKGLISNENGLLDTFIDKHGGNMSTEREIRIAISKVLLLASKDIHHDAKSTSDQGSLNGWSKIGSSKIGYDEQIETNNSIAFNPSDIHSIASEFVNERKHVARETVLSAIQAIVSEMNERHVAILEKTKRKYSKQNCGLNQAISNVAETSSMNKEELEQKRFEDTRKLVAKLEEKHKAELKTLQNEQERFIIELQRKHQGQIEKLREEKDQQEKLHERALNSYLTASCDALKILKRRDRKK